MFNERFKSSRCRKAYPRSRGGFTLVELLVVISVMVTLGGMLTYALASAQNDARLKRTQADVLTIGQLLQTRANEVALSRVNLVFGPAPGTSGTMSGPATPTAPTAAQLQTFNSAEQARVILAARRDLMRMVMPECRADLLYPPASLQFRTLVGISPATWVPNVAQLKPPAQWNAMRTLAGLDSGETLDAKVFAANGTNPVNDPTVDGIAAAYDVANSAWVGTFYQFSELVDDGSGTFVVDTLDLDGYPSERFWTRENESAECLYLILATTQLFGKRAIDQIHSSRIGDTDGDGFREILDAWGEPYVFIRNPVSLDHPTIRNFDPSGTTSIEQFPVDPDGTDLLLVDFRNDSNYRPSPDPYAGNDNVYYPIYVPPVVISSGQDRDFGIRISYKDQDNDGLIVGTEAVPDSYSSSAVQLAGYGPLYPTVPIARYPDPYFNIGIHPPLPQTSLTPPLNEPPPGNAPPPTGTTYVLSNDGIVASKMGGGLGGTLDRSARADNVTSLDSGF